MKTTDEKQGRWVVNAGRGEGGVTKRDSGTWYCDQESWELACNLNDGSEEMLQFSLRGTRAGVGRGGGGYRVSPSFFHHAYH